MSGKKKKYVLWMLLVFGLGVLGYLGYTCQQLVNERDALTTELESEKQKFKVLQRKYGEQKALAATLQRAKLAVEGELRKAQQAVTDLESEKAMLEEKVDGMEAEYQRKTAKLEERIDKYAERLEKLKENRDQYKAKLAETVQIVKERNDMIYKLTAERDELSANLQQTSSELKRCEKHNVRLVELADELVVAYENKGVGDTLLQGEPFTQLKKVEVEKFVQIYKDRIDNDNLELVKPQP